jgi:glycosidase
MRARGLAAVLGLLATGCPSHQTPFGDDAPPDDAGGGAPDADPAAPDALPPWDGPGADPRVWRPRVIYLTMPDRFASGSAANDAAGHAECHDPANPIRFHGGDLAGLRAHLPYLSELGVGALWTTPLHRQAPRRDGSDQCGYHGYWADLVDPAEPVTDALEPKLGTPAELDALLAELAAAGIAPILDVVVNHPARNARIVTQHPDWFHPADTCAELGPSDIYCPLSGLPDFAHERADVAAYVTATTVAWLDRYPFAGVRMDTAKHVELGYFADTWRPAARAARPHPFIVAEVFTDGDMSQFARYFDAGFDSVFHFPLRRALVDAVARGGSLDDVAAVMRDTLADLGLDRALMTSTFLDNHDVPRFMTEAGELSDAERVRRYRVALALLFTLPGIPQLYQGDELGLLGAYPDNRRMLPAWAFDPAARDGARDGYLGNPAETFALTRRLIALRGAHPALHAGYYAETWRPNGGANVFSFYRASGDDRVLVVVNGGGGEASVTMRFAANPGITEADRAAWPDGTQLVDRADLGAPAALVVDGGEITATLPGRTVGIYVVE